MKNPQTLAMNLNKKFPNEKLNTIGKKACCAFVLMWCLGIEPDDADAIMLVDDLMKHGGVDKNCTVYWADAIKLLTGRTIKKIDFTKITSISDIKGRTPVLYKKKPTDETGHWVGIENGAIIFNPLSYSECVLYGKPVEKRVIYF